MPTILKPILFSLGAAVALTTAGHAQSLSSLPPNGGEPPQTARTAPYGSTQSFYPKPGGIGLWKDQYYRPPGDYAVNKADHPYSTSIGPSPGSHSSGTGTERPYNASARDAQPTQHPYSAGMGPKPN
jgi:hypothetical protein